MRRVEPEGPNAGSRAWRYRAGAWALCAAIEAVALGGSAVELVVADHALPAPEPVLFEALYATSRSLTESSVASSVEAFDAVSSKLPWTAASIALSSAISM